MPLGQYTIFGHWGPRPEEPEALARRFSSLLDRLALIDPSFGGWFWTVDRDPIAFSQVRPRLSEAIADCVAKDSTGVAEVERGYTFCVANALDYMPRAFVVFIQAGRSECPSIIVNNASIETPWDSEPDPTIVTYPIFKPALLALAECFEMSWCRAYSYFTVESRSDVGRTPFHRAWMSYVAPDLAPLVTPPPTAIVEVRPNGGIFMAATDETYIDTNPAHRAVACDIEAAVAPLENYPWKMRMDQ